MLLTVGSDGVQTRLVFETHSWSEDNERGVATGWLPGRLSERGRALALELGGRRRNDNLTAVFTSDLFRAVETAELAFDGTGLPVLHDWRLRECDFGSLNGTTTDQVHSDRQRWLRTPYPGGESWEQAVARVGSFLRDFPARWAGSRVLVIGHVATKWGFDQHLHGVRLEELVDAEFGWQEGWEYLLDQRGQQTG
jgi:alpha-ribazole phosphatase/probable phosphoglycerate mutase